MDNSWSRMRGQGRCPPPYTVDDAKMCFYVEGGDSGEREK